MKQNEPRRHHYVPEIYQKGFVDRDERLWLYDRQLQRYRKVHPRHICRENELYTIAPEAEQNRYIETEWLSRLDGEGATAIRQFESGLSLDDEWKESFSVFMAQQITRTPAFRDMTKRNYKVMGEEYLRLGFTDVERARQLLEDYRAQTGDTSGDHVTAESMVEAVVGGHIQVSVGEGPFLRNMVQQIEFLARWINAFEWQILKAAKDTGFIICDYPFVVVPAQGHSGDVGLCLPGTVKYFPLTRASCLRMGDPDYGFSYQNITNQEVRRINQNIAVNSERFIMGPSRTQLENIVARSGTRNEGFLTPYGRRCRRTRTHQRAGPLHFLATAALVLC